MNISNTYARNKALFIVVGVSLGLHVLGLVFFGTWKIVESITREDQTFEAPEIAEVPQEQPEYTVNLEQRNQSSAPPRPNPIVVDSPDVSIPALDIDVNIANASSYGRGGGGVGSGIGDMREMVIGELDFFGAKSTGSNVVMILDTTWSGASIFRETRAELFNTIDQMRGLEALFAVIYFGGATAGHVVGSMDVDPTKADYRFPPGIPEREWLSADGEKAKKIIAQLKGINPRSGAAKVKTPKNLDKPGAFFVRGTQYWGAVNAAFRMRPPPDTVFLMVEPSVAFPDMNRTKRSYAWFEEHGRRKPRETTVQLIIGKMPTGEKLKALRWMANELNGGRLSDSEIDERITATR